MASYQKNSLKAWGVLSCAWMFYLYEYILRVSPSVMTHQLMVDFSVTATTLGLLNSFYYFAYVPLQIPCGIIVDYLGLRRVITASALLCTLGTFLFAQSTTLLEADLGRFLMGIGSACACLSCSKTASVWFFPSSFALIAGITQFMGNMGGIFASTPLAILVKMTNWRVSMVVFSCVGLLVTALCWIFIKDTPYKKSLAVTHQEEEKGSISQGLKLIASNSQSWVIALYGCMMYLPLTAFAELWGVPFLMRYYGIDSNEASFGSIMVFVGMGIGCILAAPLSTYFKSRKRVMSLSAIGTALVFSFVFYFPFIPIYCMFAILFLGGLVSGGQILYFTSAKESNPLYVSGTTIGFTNCGVMLSGIIFPPLLGYLLDQTWSGIFNPDGTRFYSLYDYRLAFLSVCCALFVAWILVFYIKETYNDN